jgi:nucleoside-diphosphate-sugar epimerase
VRVLVTGSGGYLGAAVVPALLAARHEVVGLDTGLFSGCTFGPPPVIVPTLTKDLRDVTGSDLEGIDGVVHLAAVSNDPVGERDPQTTHDINHLATTSLARAAREAGVTRFAYSSTCSVYGASGGDALVTEDAPMAPVTAYAVSKVAAEQDLHELCDESFTTVALRNATVYGLSPRLRLDVVVNNLVASAVLTGQVLVMSDGTPWRPLVHVDDVAQAFLSVLEAPADAVAGQSFNTGRDGENYRVSEVAEAVAAAVPGAEVVITGEAGNDPRSYRVDFTRLSAAVPAYVPRWTVPEGAAQLAAAFAAHGLVPDDLQRRCIRLRWLAFLQESGRISDDLRWV